jgi:hypothetical protein
MDAGNADEIPPAPNGAYSEDTLAVLDGFSRTTGLSKEEQFAALRDVVRYAEDNNCHEVVDKAYNYAIEILGLDQIEVDQQISLESWSEEPTSKFEHGLLAEEKSAERAWFAEPRPELIIDSSDPTIAAKALARLIAARDNFLFNGNSPVYIAAEAGNLPRAIVVNVETVRIRAHEICVPVKRDKKGKSTPIALNDDVAGLYLRGLEGSWGLKPFNGITTAPILDNDGSIRIAKGYDQKSGMWCHKIPAVPVPEHPTKEQAELALGYIRHTFRTFPFADGKRVRDQNLDLDVIDAEQPAGLDESSFLTMLLTGVCRQSLDTAPGLLCDAPSFSGAGTGKGLLVKAICIIASGARPAAFTSGRRGGAG